MNEIEIFCVCMLIFFLYITISVIIIFNNMEKDFTYIHKQWTKFIKEVDKKL